MSRRGEDGAAPPGCTELHFDGALYAVRAGETVFEALLRGGADIRYSCKKGSCHTCLLQVTEGRLPVDSQRDLPAELAAAGAFLPCITRPQGGQLRVQRLDATAVNRATVVLEKINLGPGILGLKLEPPRDYVWHAGQHLMLVTEAGQARLFSIVSSMDESVIELHLRHVAGGAVSGWAHEHWSAGSSVSIQNPTGDVYYRREFGADRLLLIGTGTGAGMLVGIARAALKAGHMSPIHLSVGIRDGEAFYLGRPCAELHARYPWFTYTCVAGGSAGRGSRSPLLDDAFEHNAGETTRLFLCGGPEMVASARVRALAEGVRPSAIHADPFTVHNYQVKPRDKEKLAAVPPDTDLWHALGEGAGLRHILTVFYEKVYSDDRLSPFFHRVTMARAIDKQYEFLRDVFSGTKNYFGTRPFSAHHWMVISDELFDYREALFFECVEQCGIEQQHIAKWRAFHELFRAELVKHEPRGLIVDGVEQHHAPYTDEYLGSAAVCDGCGSEIASDAVSRVIRRTGQLFCAGCASLHSV